MEGVLSEGVLSEGVLSGGGFVRTPAEVQVTGVGGFGSWVYQENSPQMFAT